MAKDYETAIFTKQQVKSARVKGQVKGWAQGAGATLVVMMLLKFFGWVPALLLLVAIVIAGFGLARAIGWVGDRATG